MTTPEMMAYVESIRTVEDVIQNSKIVFDVVREDVYKVVCSRGWLFEDFDAIYSIACAMTSQTLLKSHLSSVKKFYQSENAEMAIRWLIQRIVSNMRNAGFNPKYENYTLIKRVEAHEIVKLSFDDDMVMMIDELYRLDSCTLLQGLRQVWEDALGDFDFDEIDFRELCEKFGFTVNEVMGENLLLKAEQTVGGHRQLVLFF